MSGMHPENPPGSVHDDQLAWEFEIAVRELRAMDKGPEIFRALGRQMVVRMARHDINSTAAVEIAFESVLNDFREGLSPHAQQRLLEYLIDRMPAEQADYRPGDPYFKAAVESFGPAAVVAHITRGMIFDENEQLSLDVKEDNGPPADPR